VVVQVVLFQRRKAVEALAVLAVTLVLLTSLLDTKALPTTRLAEAQVLHQTEALGLTQVLVV
jgi:hypothetical protein